MFEREIVFSGGGPFTGLPRIMNVSADKICLTIAFPDEPRPRDMLTFYQMYFTLYPQTSQSAAYPPQARSGATCTCPSEIASSSDASHSTLAPVSFQTPA
jgi:hypothetical protein